MQQKSDLPGEFTQCGCKLVLCACVCMCVDVCSQAGIWTCVHIHITVSNGAGGCGS